MIAVFNNLTNINCSCEFLIQNSISIITKQNDSKCAQLQVQVIVVKMSSAHTTHSLSSKCTNVPDDDLKYGRHISLYNVRYIQR